MAQRPLADEKVKATVQAYQKCGGNHVAAAAELGISINTLRSRLAMLRSRGQLGPATGSTPNPVLIDDRIRLEGERKRNKELERELLEARRRVELAHAAKTVAPDRTVKIAPYPKNGKRRQAAAVSLASDWHIEEEVEAAKVNGKNSYDTETAERRAREYFKGLAWKIKHHTNDYEIDRLVLFLLGDFITGYIHPELVETAAMAPARSIAWWVELAAAGLEMLAAEFPGLAIDVPCLVGNHGRTTDKIRVATRTENSFEWLGYHMLAERFKKHPRVRFHIAEGAHIYVDVFGWTIRGTHGDDVKYYGGVGGLSVPLRKAIDSWNEARKADYTVLGHWHTVSDFGFAVVNGSLIGYSAYSQWIKARYEPPAQVFFLVDRERGKDYVSCIWVDPQGARS